MIGIFLLARGDDGVALAQQQTDLRIEKLDHGADPHIRGVARKSVINVVTVHQPDHVFRAVKGFARHPAVHPEQRRRVAFGVHGNRDDMRDGVLSQRTPPFPVIGRGLHALRNGARPHEGVKMAVFVIRPAMGVIIILAERLAVVDVAFRVMVPLIKRALMGEQLAHHIGPGFPEKPVALQNLTARRGHAPQPGSGQSGEEILFRLFRHPPASAPT